MGNDAILNLILAKSETVMKMPRSTRCWTPQTRFPKAITSREIPTRDENAQGCPARRIRLAHDPLRLGEPGRATIRSLITRGF